MNKEGIYSSVINRCDNLPAIALILVIIISIMSPLGSDIPVESPAKDLLNHISGIVEAKNALIEGQFPIRVAPNALDGDRYPIFQFYGNFPYTLGGIFFILTNDPYLAFKFVIILSLFLGAYYLYKFGLWTTNNKYAAIIASVVYLTAPYILTDIHGRFAYPELVALGLIPVIFYYFFQCTHSKNICNYVILTFFLVLLFLTHNIFTLYTLVFIFIILVLLVAMNLLHIYQVIRIILCIGLSFLMSNWYLLPQLLLVNNLVIRSVQNNPFDVNYLSTLWVLLAPSKILPLPLNYFDNPNLGFQIGYTLLTFFACGIIVLVSKQYSESNNSSKNNCIKNTYLLKILILCSIISVILIWSPINFWIYFPNQLLFVQFPFRILGYLVIFGAMITPIAIVRIFDDFKIQHAIIICLICISFTSTYLPNHIGESKDSIIKEISNPDMGRGGATTVYQMSKDSLSSTNFPYGEKINLLEGYSGGWLLNTASISLNQFQYSGPIVIRMKGTVPDQIKYLTLKFFANGEYLQQIDLPQGSFNFDIPIDNLSKYYSSQLDSSKNELIIEIQSDKYFIPNEITPQNSDKRQLSLLLDSFEIFSPISSSEEYISARDPKIQKVSSNEFFINGSKIAIIELPVLYYPDMLEIKINGESVPYFNIGNKIGIKIQPGTNQITVDFVGSKIANYVSAISWIIFCLFCGYCLKKHYFGGITKNDS
jgi:hypothetical protein